MLYNVLDDRGIKRSYPVSKELVDKALRSEQDAYRIKNILRNWRMGDKESKEIANTKVILDQHPLRILMEIRRQWNRLFSNQEFEER